MPVTPHGFTGESLTLNKISKLKEIVPGWVVPEVQALTEAELTPAVYLKEIEL